MRRPILLVIVFLLCVLMLVSCVPQRKPNENNDNDDTLFETEAIVDLTNLNYNQSYHNPQQPEQKGFVIFDYVDLNRVAFRRRFRRKPRFGVLYQDKLLETIEISPHGTVYPRLLVEKTGTYTVEIMGEGNYKENFDIYVRACGYPEEVIGSILDTNGKQVYEIKAGQQYQCKAEIYSDGQLLLEDNELFSSYWSDGEVGERTHTFIAPNRIKDGEYVCGFNYDCDLGYTTRSKNVLFSIPIKNNHKGIELDFGKFLSHSEISLSVREFPEVDLEGHYPNFLQYVKAWHIFDNDEKESIEINIGDRTIDNTIVAFVRYTEQEYDNIPRYHRKMYNGKEIIYNPDAPIYQFDPTKTTAYLYFAYCYGESFVGGVRYKYKRIEDSDFVITILK